jgi:hypothetical protein
MNSNRKYLLFAFFFCTQINIVYADDSPRAFFPETFVKDWASPTEYSIKKQRDSQPDKTKIEVPSEFKVPKEKTTKVEPQPSEETKIEVSPTEKAKIHTNFVMTSLKSTLRKVEQSRARLSEQSTNSTQSVTANNLQSEQPNSSEYSSSTIGLLISAQSEPHLKRHLSALNRLLDHPHTTAGEIIVVIDNLSPTNFLKSSLIQPEIVKIVAELAQKGASIRPVRSAPKSFAVKVSPTWLIKSSKNLHIFEGYQTPFEFFAHDGKFIFAEKQDLPHG